MSLTPIQEFYKKWFQSRYGVPSTGGTTGGSSGGTGVVTPPAETPDLTASVSNAALNLTYRGSTIASNCPLYWDTNTTSFSFTTVGNTAFFTLRIANNTGSPISGMILSTGKLTFPGAPTNAGEYDPIVCSGVDGPSLVAYKWATGESCFTSASPFSRLKFNIKMGGSTPPERALEVHLIDPVANGQTTTITFAWRFGQSDPLDAYTGYAAVWPKTWNWADRRPIIQHSTPCNTTPLATLASQTAGTAVAYDAQGVIYWRLWFAGNGYDYIGNPQLLPTLRSDWSQRAAFVQAHADAGVRIGVLLRPWTLTYDGEFHNVTTDALQSLRDQVAFAKTYLAATLFYIDSYNEAFPSDYRPLATLQSENTECLFLPEWRAIGHQAYGGNFIDCAVDTRLCDRRCYANGFAALLHPGVWGDDLLGPSIRGGDIALIEPWDSNTAQRVAGFRG
jgi:hypothetical protein